MTTNLTNGTQVSIDPSKLPIDWQPGQNYTIILNPGFVNETDNNRTPSPYQTSTFATFSAGSLDYTGVNPGTGSTGVFTSTVFINYNRPVQVGTSTNYYLYKSDGTLVSTIPATSTRVKRLTTSSITWLSSTTVVFSTVTTSTSSSVSTSSDVFIDLIPTHIFTVTNYEPPNSKSVYTTITKDISGITTTTEKQIRINLTGNILPSTEYHIRSDEGVVVDMFKFKSLPHIASTITKFTTGAGPTIVGITPAYNTTTNINAVTLQFSKVMTLNTGNFYLNDNTGTIRTIPVIGPTVSLLNTNTVQIVINNQPTPEDAYFLAWDEGVLIDTNTLAIYGVNDDGAVKFYNQVMRGLGSKIYDHGNPTYPFTTATITDLNSGSYQLSVSSPYGEFSHLSAGTNGGTYWSMTGTPAQINAAIPTVKFVPSTNFGADTNYHWVLTRDSVPIYDRTFDLIGGPYQLPVTPPGDPDNVSPGNRATLTFSVSSLGVISEPVALTATIVSYVPLGGVVQFKGGGSVIATATMSSSGVATTTTIFYSTGTKAINAVWLGGQMGDLKYDTLTSNTASVFIDSAAILNFSITSNDNPQLSVNSSTFTAIANAPINITGPVTFGVYNTSTRAFTQILGTSTFANNSASITVNSGTFSVGTYTVAAVWTGSNIIPKYYASTATMRQSYVNKGPVRLVAKNPSFYWHNIDGVNLDTAAFAEVTISGIYSAHQPTGTVKLFDGGTLLDTMDLSQRTTFTWNPTNFNQVDAGNKTLTVQYLGDEWNLTATTSTAFNTVTQTTSSYLFSAYSRRNSSMTLTTTATTSTVYRPYGTITFKAQTTSTYWNNKLINVKEGNNIIATPAISGTSATFVFDSKNLATGSHAIRTQYPQDWAYNEILSNVSTFTVAKTTLPITLTRTSATVLRPSTVTLTLASTASFYTAETVQIYDNGQPWFTVSHSGTSTSITTSSSYFSTGTHIVKAGLEQDDNYNAVESSTSSIFIDKSTIPLTLDNSNPASTSTISIVPIGLFNEFDHTMLEFRPVNTATFLSNFTAQPLNGVNLPGPGGSTFNLYFNAWPVDDVVIGQTPTFYQYYIKNNRYFLQVWRYDPVTGQPNEYAGPTDDDNPIFNKWTTYTTGTVTAELTSIIQANNTITRPANVTFNIRSTSTFNVPKTVKILDNGILFTSTTYTGTFTSITTSSSYIPVGSHNFQAFFDGDNDYYSSISLTRPLSIGKYQPGAITLTGPQTIEHIPEHVYGVAIDINGPILRPNKFSVIATTTDSFFNGKTVIAVYNNTNIGTAIFNDRTATFEIDTMSLGVGQKIYEYISKPGDPPIINNPYSTQGGTSTINISFIETNDTSGVTSNNFDVFTSKAPGPVISIMGPVSSTATIFNNQLNSNKFDRNFPTEIRFTATTTGSYWANKSINFYNEQSDGNNTKILLSSTTLVNGSATVSIQTTSSLFSAIYRNYVYAEIAEDDTYSTSTHVNLLYSTGTGNRGWLIQML